MNIHRNQFTGLILAGGEGSRMGFVDKPLLRLDGKTIIQWIFSHSEKHIDHFLISLNRNHAKYHQFGYPTVSDVSSQARGPLIGIYSAMEFISRGENSNDAVYLITLPGDVPFFPEILIPKLMVEMKKRPRDLVITRSEHRLEPLFAIWALSAKHKLKQHIEDGFFGPKQILSKLNHQIVSCKTQSALEFLNINTEKELKIAQNLISEG